jgi:hypothetical protein
MAYLSETLRSRMAARAVPAGLALPWDHPRLTRLSLQVVPQDQEGRAVLGHPCTLPDRLDPEKENIFYGKFQSIFLTAYSTISPFFPG